MERWVTFDCYGTLIDWDRGIETALSMLWPDQPRADLLADYHGVEPVIERDGSLTYREVLERAVRAIAAVRDIPLAAERAIELADSLPEWPAFPEVPAALGELRQVGWKLGILSNTDPAYIEASIKHLGVEVDEIVVASAIGSYKPRHGHWQEFLRRVGKPDVHVHVAASLFHDIAPCAELAIPAVWINRLQQASDLPRAGELTDLSPLPATLSSLVS